MQIAREVGLDQGQVHRTIMSFLENQKMHNPPSSLQFFNIWEFGQADNSYGDKEFPGRMPGQVVENLLWYYTKPLDLVIDPMAGFNSKLPIALMCLNRLLVFGYAILVMA